MNVSVFRGSIRIFFFAFFAILGIFAAIIAGTVGIAALFGSSKQELDYQYKVKILPNAKGTRKILDSDSPAILIVDISGIIGVETLKMSHIRSLLTESREKTLKNNRVKGLILNINSPGGTVTDSDGIYRLIKAYKEQYQVPVYAYIDGICASGGMYIACSADKVYSSESSLIGSVGVLTPSFFNATQVLDKIGVKALTLSAGKNKDSMNPFRPWKEDEAKPIQAIIDTLYKQFVQIVAENRPELTVSKLIEEYGANVFAAPVAKEYGYVDVEGASLNQVIADLTETLGINNNKYQVVQLEKKSWVSQLFQSNQALLPSRIIHQVQLSPELHPDLMNQYLYLYHPAL